MEHMQEEVMFQMNCRANLTTAHVIKDNGVLWDLRA